jgi:hypothetical protein
LWLWVVIVIGRPAGIIASSFCTDNDMIQIFLKY